MNQSFFLLEFRIDIEGADIKISNGARQMVACQCVNYVIQFMNVVTHDKKSIPIFEP
mgnify:CR=1 FL=1